MINYFLELFNFIIINCFIAIFLGVSFPLFSQQKSLEDPENDTVFSIVHSPKKAARMSALLPGLGQAYNKKYWKIPVIWAGFGGLTYSIIYNNNKYVTYRDAYLYRVDDDNTTVDDFPMFSTNYLQSLKNSYRHNLELSIILTAALYAINVIDATVDAHLFDFDISEDVSMKLTPLILVNSNNNVAVYPSLMLNLQLSNNSKKK